jgi:hypothetical protein
MSEIQAAPVTAVEATPEEAAVAFLKEASASEVSQSADAPKGGKAGKLEPETATDEPEDAVEEEPTEEPVSPVKTEAELLKEQRAEYAQKLNEVDSRFAQARRKEQALQARQQEFEAKVKQLEERERKLTSFDNVHDLVEYIAENNKVDVNQIWHEIADGIRNNGKRTPESAMQRELRELREERKREKEERERTAREEQERQQATQEQEVKEQWATESGVLARTKPERWPSLAKSGVSARLIGVAALRVVEEYYGRTGLVPEREAVLDFLEQVEAKEAQASAPAKPVMAAKKPASTPRTPTNTDAEANVSERELSDEDRERDAAEYLRSFGKKPG